MDLFRLSLAWRRIEPYEEDCSTIVPLLICSDDLDFSCTVVVVEQEIADAKVIWHRFGFAFDRPGDQVGTSVKWFKKNASAIFSIERFNEAIAEFKRLEEEWRNA